MTVDELEALFRGDNREDDLFSPDHETLTRLEDGVEVSGHEMALALRVRIEGDGLHLWRRDCQSPRFDTPLLGDEWVDDGLHPSFDALVAYVCDNS